jgi:hypothetical protein
MHLEVAILKNDASRAVRDDTGNPLDKKASDAWVCIKAALQRRRDSGGTVARGAINSLVRRIILPRPPDVNPGFAFTTGIELPLAGPRFSATICA